MTNRVIMAAAGSGKTEFLIRNALESADKRILITTYTHRNAEQLTDRICERCGTMPANIMAATWFEFLLRDGIKPYQSTVTDPNGTAAVSEP